MTAPTPDTEERPDPLVVAIESALSDVVAWRKPTYLSDTVQSLVASGDYRKAAEVMAPRIRSLVDIATPPQADRGLRRALLRIFDLAENRPDIRSIVTVLLRDTSPAGLDVERLARAIAAVSPEGTKYPERLAAEYERLRRDQHTAEPIKAANAARLREQAG